MTTFKSKISQLKKEIQAVCDKNKEWFCSEFFLDAIKKEIRRSYRTSLPVSLISIKFKPESNHKSDESTIRYLTLLNKLIEIISLDTSECDIKHLSEKYVIEVLLIDTALDGAKFFTEKISEKLYNQYKSNENRELQNIIKDFKFAVYPLNQISGNNRIEATPIIIKDMEFNQINEDSSTRSITNWKSHFHINWEAGISSNGSLVLYPSIPWDTLIDKLHWEIYQIVKRLMDILLAYLALVIVSPTMILISILIKITSSGPVLFKQKRLGSQGVPFTFLKFRTMRSGCDELAHKNFIEKFINGDNAEVN